MKFIPVVLLLSCLGCSVVDRIVSTPEVVVPVIEKAAIAASAPSIVTIADVAIALVAALTGAAGVGAVSKIKKKAK